MNVIWDIIQGGDDWIGIRKGKITASNLDKIITAKTCAISKQSDDFINELIEECFFKNLPSWSGNFWMEWGKEYEAEARLEFSKHTGLAVREAGFVIGDDPTVGCSPDGLIMAGEEIISGVEIKCPRPKTHIGYIRDGVLPDAYIQQVHGSMAITGLDTWHFWSYAKGLMPLHIIVRRNDYTAKLETALAQFVASYKAAYADALPRLKIPNQ